MAEGSPAARRQIGRLLKRLREDSGKTVQAVGDAKVAGATKVWRIETGKTMPSVSDVLGLCWLYGADPSTTTRLTDMIVELHSSSGGWWENYGESLQPFMSMVVGMEQSASAIRVYEPEIVYGLLQTAGYAQAADPSPENAAKNAEVRLARQRAVLKRTDPFTLFVVLGQGALLRQVGGSDVLAAQTQRLRDVSADPRIQIRVLTWEAGMHPAFTGPFTLFEFDEDDPVVYVPWLRGGRYIEKPQQVSAHQAAFDTIWQQAIPMKEFTP